MAKNQAKERQPPKVNPIKPGDFGTAAHQYTQFSAIVSGDLVGPNDADIKILETPRLWAHAFNKMKAGDECRVVADDCSFRAQMLCTYAYGSEIRMKVVSFVTLEEVDYDALSNVYEDYQLKQRGIRKWCIQKISTSEFIKENIATQSEASKWLEEYVKASAA